MGKFAKKFSIMMVVAGMTTSALAGCSGKEAPKDNSTVEKTETTDATKKEESQYNTLVVATSQLNGVFSPFFSTTMPDGLIWYRTAESLIENDPAGAPISNLADFKIEEIKDAEGKVTQTKYIFKLKDDVKFSDGTPITADDIVFTYQVLADPTYDGATVLYSIPILGINEYRYDDVDYAAKIAKLKEQADAITDEEVKQFIIESTKGSAAAYGEEKIVEYLGGKVEGLDKLEGDKKLEALDKAYAEFEIANAFDSYKAEAGTAKFKTLEKEYIKANLEGGTTVTEIEGIKKVDEKTVEVTIDGVDPNAIWTLGSHVSPKHYYGVGADGKEFTKGDLSMVREKSDKPMGAGAYVFESYENNIVTLRASENYFKGSLQIPTIKYQVAAAATQLDAVKKKEIDIAAPNANPALVEDTKASGIHYELLDNLGYGYIGMNAERLVDKNVRKGLMHLMNRGPAVETYYGELATVIERPMSTVSWAYPQDAEEYYGFDPAKALECFTAAGYKQVDKGGKKVLEKEGKQLKVEVGIGGEGTMDHPAAPIITQMKTELEKIGGILEVNDCDGAILFDRLNAGEWDMWVAAWQASLDPDMTQIYSSTGPTNHYKIKDDRLDQVIMEARSTNDIEVRKELYSEALDIVMDEAVEMPVYQRKNMYIFNPEVINIDTLPAQMSPFYRAPYFSEITTLSLR